MKRRSKDGKRFGRKKYDPFWNLWIHYNGLSQKEIEEELKKPENKKDIKLINDGLAKEGSKTRIKNGKIVKINEKKV